MARGLLAVIVALFVATACAVPSISVTPDHIQIFEPNAVVTWSGVTSPSDKDWIGAFSPPTASTPIIQINLTVPLSFGLKTLALLNMRTDYQFKYIHWNASTNAFAAIASSNVITVDPGQPMQGHISLTEDPTQMRVMWVSGGTSEGTVEYGRVPSQYTAKATGRNYTYNLDQMCGYRAVEFWREPGTIFDVLLTGLTPATTYYYHFGSDNDGWSQEASFTTAPLVGSTTAYPLTLLAFGDLGTGVCEDMAGWCEGPSIMTTGLLASEVPGADLLIHIGDISYAVGWAERWEQFFYQIQEVATQVPWMVCIGNHEVDYIAPYNNYMNSTDSGGECGVPFHARFNMPGIEFVPGSKPTAADRYWWSFEYGPIHYTFMSTEHDFTTGSPQLAWLAQDLAAVDRTRTPWLIFAGHRPMYVSSYSTGWYGDNAVSERLRNFVEPLLLKNEVNLVLWGHTHLFERTCPVYEMSCMGEYTAPQAPVHAVIGMAGQSLSTNIVYPAPEWSGFRMDSMYGYTRINFFNATTLQLEFMGDNGNLYDQFYLTNPYAK
jgi:hypothetical protein